MTIYLSSDHRGFRLKERLKKYLIKKGYPVHDTGAYQFRKQDDYVDFARRAAEHVSRRPAVDRGIMICGSGHGMDMVANKYKNVRAALGFNKKVAVQSREHENANVLILPSDWVRGADAEKIAHAWLTASFSGGARHKRRLAKIRSLERRVLR